MNVIASTAQWPLLLLALSCAPDTPGPDTGEAAQTGTGEDSASGVDSGDTGGDERPMGTVWLTNGSGEDIGGINRIVDGLVESIAGGVPADMSRFDLQLLAGDGAFNVTDTDGARCWGRDLALAEGEEVEITTGVLEFEVVGFGCRY